jgi:phosphohistidine phosphatase
MELLIVRHGIAVEPGTGGMSDGERPLTDEGKKKFREAARGLAKILPVPDVLLSSPLVRARQTAEIAAAAWKKVRVVLDERLAGGSVDDILSAVSEHAKGDLVVVVGHEPDVSHLAAKLLGTGHATRLAFKKGGAALFEVSDRPQRGGTLLWFASQRLLRGLGE